jgi:hypothetical protein
MDLIDSDLVELLEERDFLEDFSSLADDECEDEWKAV